MDHHVQPLKTSLVADLLELININLAELLRVKVVTCPACQIQSETAEVCPTCDGIGAIERYVLDHELLKTYRYGRLVEGFDIKHGQLVPKIRSKDKAFTLLVKLLGFDRAIIEIANAATFAESLSVEQRATYVEQLKEMAGAGLLDGMLNERK